MPDLNLEKQLKTLETERKAMGARIEQLERQHQRLVRGLTATFLRVGVPIAMVVIEALIADSKKEEDYDALED